MTDDLELVLRAPDPSELELLTQTYVREGRRSLWGGDEMQPRAWDRIAERFLAACVEDGHALVVGSRDGSVCAGYALGTRVRGSKGADRAIVHWVYVRGIYRGRGLARRLVEHMTRGVRPADVRVTHSCNKRHAARIRSEGWRFASRVPWLWLLSRDPGDF